MANVKTLDIRFNLPLESAQDSRFHQFLGSCSLPWIGLRLTLSQPFKVTEAGKPKYWVSCALSGSEAVGWTWIEERLYTLNALGAVFSQARAADTEANGPACTWAWVNYAHKCPWLRTTGGR